jgi:histidine triad (HIT) family protein
MKKNDCIFCLIADGKIPSYKVYEDDKFLAFLDIFPNTEGMTLLIPKEHFDSYAFEMPDEILSDFVLTAKKLGNLLDKKLGVQRTALVMEGMGVNHAHIKLYPLHGLGPDFQPIVPDENKYYDKYQGYLTTLLGPKADDKDLSEVQKIILS